MPIEKGEIIRLNNIFFEFNKADLKSESFNELDRLYSILIDNKTLKIEISGHTDDKGSDEYNKSLSNSRANSVMNYLTSKGIDKTRLTAVGYGESQPVVANDTDENRAINRRVEFKVL
ncbi:MAG: OmpA family protein [Flavobacteriales bacterium]|nr:OmpA family protein [Flavobacteriales bacterium]MCB9334644.1 OmpA family protein [Flavobacteriales bacterium]